MFVGDPAQLADLDAAELAGADEVVHLVPADVQDLGYLLDGVSLHGLTSSGRGWRWFVRLLPISLLNVTCACARARCDCRPYVQTSVRRARAQGRMHSRSVI